MFIKLRSGHIPCAAQQGLTVNIVFAKYCLKLCALKVAERRREALA